MMISVAQLNALDLQVLERYGRELRGRLEAEWPQWAGQGSEDSRQQQVSEVLRYGRSLKLVDAEDLYLFTSALIRFGLGIPLRPELLSELRNPAISRAAQIENLMLRLLSNRDGKTAVRL